MFDIGFFELVIIAVIALLVLGPERLPHAVRMTGAWIGKFRRAAMSVREEIEREVNAYEVQQRIKEHMDNTGINETKEMLEQTKQQLRNGILDEDTLKEIEKRGLQDYAKSLTEAPATPEHTDSDNQPEDAQPPSEPSQPGDESHEPQTPPKS